jgi:hypothetical protein
MKDTMMESFAIVLSENMTELDEWFQEAKTPIELQARPDVKRFRAGRALIISQDSHNRVFAVVGCLEDTLLDGRILSFGSVQRFTIPVVITNASGQTSDLALGKGYVNQFMYLAPSAEERIMRESEELCCRQPIG